MMRPIPGGVLCLCVFGMALPVAAQDAGPLAYDLTLADALEIARTKSPSVQIARGNVDGAKARLVGASVPFANNPTLSVGGGPRVGPDETTPDLDVGIEQVFELGGQRRARVDAVQAEIERETLLAADALRRSLQHVAEAFLWVRYAEERLEIATDADKLAAETHRVALRRQRAGDVGGLDVKLAGLTRARTQIDVQRAIVARDRSVGRLRLLLALEPDAALTTKGDLLNRRRYSLRGLDAAAPKRPDLLALDAEVRQSEAEERLAASLSTPDLGLGVGYAREEDADVILGTLTVSLPFFDHGQGLEAQARARRAKVRVQQELAERKIRVEVQTAFETYERLLAATEAFESDGLPLVEETAELAIRSYGAGAMPLTDVLGVRRELVSVRVAHADLLLNTALAGVELEAEAGVLR